MPSHENLNKETVEKFSLKTFLNYQNPKAKEYEELIKTEVARTTSVKERSGLDPPIDEYSEQWLNKIFLEVHKELLEFIREKISRELLVDLGGGRRATMKWLAKEFKVKTYIDVEKYLADKFPLDPVMNIAEQLGQTPEEAEETEIVLVKADMLNFVSRVPDNSVNFVINGIDTFVIDSPKYHSALAREISRTTKIGGVVFGINADALYELQESRFRDVTREQKVYREDIKVFEKIK